MSDHYTYRITWSAEDGEHVGLCAEFPSLSWLAPTPEEALAGIRSLVVDCVSDMRTDGEPIPEPFGDRAYSGKFMVRVPPDLHRSLAIRAAEQGVSMNRLVSARLAREGCRVKRIDLGRELEAALGEVLAHVRGEAVLPSRIVDDPAAEHIVALRKRMKLSRQRFADRFGLDARAVQDWEQGRRVPDRAARVLLTVIDRNLEAVVRALDERAPAAATSDGATLRRVRIRVASRGGGVRGPAGADELAILHRSGARPSRPEDDRPQRDSADGTVVQNR